LQIFNNKLREQLNALVFDINKQDKEKQRKLLVKKLPLFKKIALLVPATVGWLLHLPLYWPLQKTILKKTAYNDHYDSVMAAILLFIYPIYLLLIAWIVFYTTQSSLSFLFLLLLPFTAWSYVQLKPQLDK
jgi:1-acyl-sn-glycerol-3-phosphate acyltransferase